MVPEFAIRHWSLVIASILFVGVGLFVMYRVFSDSARGQLGARVRDLDRRYQDADKAHRAVARTQNKLEKLGARASRVKPRLIDETRAALGDAQALLKIAEDQVLIAENHVRKVIVEEYPPDRQESLRTRYLRSEAPQGKPFSF